MSGQGADVRTLLQALGAVAGRNLVLLDEVQGAVTVQLQPMSVAEALQMVAIGGGLGAVTSGTITYVGAPPPRVADNGVSCR